MIRFLCALLVVLSIGAVSASDASARPPEPETCTFILGFAAFREALGEDIVGDCESDQNFDKYGNAHQRTTEGVLTWIAGRNLISFRDDSRLWTAGPGGFDATVVITGLGGGDVPAAPVRARAADVLWDASLEPSDLGEDWKTGDSPLLLPATFMPNCGTLPENRELGTVQSWLVDPSTRRVVSQTLMAVPEWDTGPRTPAMQRWLESCGVSEADTPMGKVTVRIALEPFEPMGDESSVLRIEFDLPWLSQPAVSRMATVRYGGLISTVMQEGGPDVDNDDALADLARRAEQRLAGVATGLARTTTGRPN